MIKVLKILLTIGVVCIVYYFLSVFLTKNGDFIHKTKVYSKNIKESKDRNIFLYDNPEIKSDSTFKDLIFSELNIWVDKSMIINRIGFLPLQYTSSIDSLRCLNITFKNNQSDYLIKIGNKNLRNPYTVVGTYCELGVKHISLFNKQKKKVVSFEVLIR